jgi:hypothetical protein
MTTFAQSLTAQKDWNVNGNYFTLTDCNGDHSLNVVSHLTGPENDLKSIDKHYSIMVLGSNSSLTEYF